MRPTGTRPVSRGVLLLRVLALGAALLAVFEPSILRASGARSALKLVDVSGSLGDAVGDVRAGVPAGDEVLAFADGVESVAPGEDPLQLPREASRIGAALVVASERLGAAAGDVLLVTDGRDTEGRALEAAADLASRGHRVFVSPPPHPLADVGLLSAEAEGAASTGPVSVRVRLSSSVSGRVRVGLVRGGRPVDAVEVDVAPGDGAEARLSDAAAGDASAAYDVTLSPLPGTPDDDRANDRLSVVVHRGGTAVVLGPWAGAATQESGVTLRVVDSLREGEPLRDSDVQAADVLVLSNLPWEVLGRTGAETIGRYVAGGGRVLVLGGPAAYAAGNWRGTLFESLLPLISQSPDGGGLAVVLAIDRSGSAGESPPGGAPALASLTTAALRLIDGLEAGESVLVLPFSDVPESQPLGPGWVRMDDEAGRKALAAAVRGLQPSGGTRLDLAVVAAARRLRDSPAKTKRVLLLTDGDPDHPPSPASFAPAAIELAAAGAVFGAVVAGDAEAARALREGLHAAPEDVLVIRDAKEFPDELFRAIGRVRARDEVREGPFAVQAARGAGDAVGLEAIAPSRVADLRPAAGADVFAYCEKDGRHLPFAGSLARGAGRVLSLAWGPQSEPEAGRAAACARLMPLIERLAGESDRGLSANLEGERLVVAAGAAYAGRGQAWVRQGTNSPPSLLLETSPGIYTGTLPPAILPDAALLFEVQAVAGGGATATRPIHLAARPPAEHRGSGVDGPMLLAIARAGGGRVLAAGEAPPPLAAATPISLSPILLAVALALFLVERILVARRPKVQPSKRHAGVGVA